MHESNIEHPENIVCKLTNLIIIISYIFLTSKHMYMGLPNLRLMATCTSHSTEKYFGSWAVGTHQENSRTHTNKHIYILSRTLHFHKYSTRTNEISFLTRFFIRKRVLFFEYIDSINKHEHSFSHVNECPLPYSDSIECNNGGLLLLPGKHNERPIASPILTLYFHYESKSIFSIIEYHLRQINATNFLSIPFLKTKISRKINYILRTHIEFYIRVFVSFIQNII